MTTCRHVVGPWRFAEWTKPSGKIVQRWMPPVGGRGRIDLRPLAARALSIPEGFGFFCLDEAAAVPIGYLDLGQDLAARLSAVQTTEFATRMGLVADDLDAPSLGAVLWRLWTGLGDPSLRNDAAAVSSKGEVSLGIAGHGYIRREKFDKVLHPAVLNGIRRGYAEADDSIKRRVLDAYVKRTGLAETDITTPSGGASVSDAFTEATTVSLDANTPDAVTGKTAGTDWDEILGNWSNNSGGYAQQDTNNSGPPGSARLNPALDSSNQRIVVTINAVNDFRASGVCGRLASAANTWLGYLRDVENTDSHELIEVVTGGTPTQLAVLASDYPDPATPYPRRLEIDGSNMEAWENDVSKLTYASAGLTSNNHVGIIGEDAVTNGGAQYDDFYGEDLSAGGGGGINIAVVRRRIEAGGPF